VYNLEGGERTLLEGSAHSGVPCAQVLSVSGFFALSSLFPPRKGLFPEGKKHLFLRVEACTVDVPLNTVIVTGLLSTRSEVGGVHTGGGGRVYLGMVGRRHIYPERRDAHHGREALFPAWSLSLAQQ